MLADVRVSAALGCEALSCAYGADVLVNAGVELAHVRSCRGVWVLRGCRSLSPYGGCDLTLSAYLVRAYMRLCACFRLSRMSRSMITNVRVFGWWPHYILMIGFFPRPKR